MLNFNGIPRLGSFFKGKLTILNAFGFYELFSILSYFPDVPTARQFDQPLSDNLWTNLINSCWMYNITLYINNKNKHIVKLGLSQATPDAQLGQKIVSERISYLSISNSVEMLTISAGISVGGCK